MRVISIRLPQDLLEFVTGCVGYQRQKGRLDYDRSTFVRECLEAVDRDVLSMRTELEQLRAERDALRAELDEIKILAIEISMRALAAQKT